ncbi:MAG: hypothetical protein ABFD79_01920 [Phycisphaerales bacterium]
MTNQKSKEISQEQLFLHKSLATIKLKDALLSLTAIELCGKCIAMKTVVPALIRDAIVQYGSAFKYGNINHKRGHKLDILYIPEKHLKLHQQMITYRDQLYAHIDFDTKNPVKMKNENNIYYKLNDSSLQVCIDSIPEMKSLILCILQKLGNEIIEEHQKILEKEF